MKHILIALLLLGVGGPALAAEQVFDFHVHIWNGETSIQEYLSQLKSAKREVSGFGAILIAKKGEIERTRQKNDELIALSKRHPQIMPIASIHPYDDAAALEELRRLAAAGVKVIKMHPHTQEFDASDPRVYEICKVAGQLGVTVMMDNANIVPGDSEKLFTLALKNPKTQFVFAHLGGFNFRFWNILIAARTAKGLYSENIHFDISGVITTLADSPVEDEWVWTIRNVGVDNVLFGSDFPQFTLADSLDALNRLGLTEEEKAKIRYGNARRLFFGDTKQTKR